MLHENDENTYVIIGLKKRIAFRYIVLACRDPGADMGADGWRTKSSHYMKDDDAVSTNLMAVAATPPPTSYFCTDNTWMHRSYEGPG